MISAIIVEDEAIAREVLQTYLLKYCPQIKVLGQAENIKIAKTLIEELQPQLVFLDVEMPFGTGFDLLDACRDLRFETIFITAFADYAIKALNQAAAYYILKPVSIDELMTAVSKVEEKISSKVLFDKNKVIVDNLHEVKILKKQIVLPTMEGYDVVKIEDIVRLQANGNFTDIYFKNKSKKMVCRVLKHFEEILPPDFLRIHRSHIINLHCMISYHKGGGGYVVMEDQSEVETSAAYRDDLLKVLNA